MSTSASVNPRRGNFRAFKIIRGAAGMLTYNDCVNKMKRVSFVSIAQRIERSAPDRKVAGSTPVGHGKKCGTQSPTFFIKGR